MKKLQCLILIIIAGALLCSCSLGFDIMGFIDSDLDIANRKFEEIIQAVQSEDKDKLTSLFSKESLKVAEDFDASVDELFDYYKGELLSYDGGAGPIVYDAMDYGEYNQTMKSSYDLKTSEDSYRISFQFITEDTVNPDNVGVQSFYIIRLDDDRDPQYKYWGDREHTPGIHINVKNGGVE